MSILAEQILREFDNKKISIVEFAESDQFCNKPLYPRQRVFLKTVFLEELEGWEEDILTEWIKAEGETRISSSVREKTQWLKENGYSNFPEVQLVGGRRSSKGYITSLAVGKKMYDTWKLGDPGRYYNIDPDKEIYFMCLATAMQQAKAYQYADLVSAITRCKALQPYIGKVQEETFTLKTSADEQYISQMRSKGMKIGRDFAKLRGVPKSANADSIRGSATMVIVFDEAAFMTSTEGNSSSLEQCYYAAEPALAQFGKDGMIFLNSSPYTKIGFFYDRFLQSHDSNEDGTPKFPTLLSFQFPSWEFYRDYQKDPNRRFKSAIMVSPDLDPEKLSSEDRDKSREAKLSEKANPDKFKVERRGQWAEVVDSYLNPENVDKAFLSEFRGVPIAMNTGGTYKHQYFAHCDPSSTTAGFGFALGHMETFQEDGQEVPHVVFDVVKRWNPKDFPGETIQYEVIVDELVRWCQVFFPFELSFDQYYSNVLIQSIRSKLLEKRVHTRVTEKVATASANFNKYESLKTAINLGLVHVPPDCPDSDYAKMELKFLQIRNGRVDKQDIGPIQTKDIADCIAEITSTILGGNPGVIAGLKAPLRYGSQGGYGIGMDRTFEDYYRDSKKIDPMSTRSMDYRRKSKKR